MMAREIDDRLAAASAKVLHDPGTPAKLDCGGKGAWRSKDPAEFAAWDPSSPNLRANSDPNCSKPAAK
jgi:hypothetical protein